MKIPDIIKETARKLRKNMTESEIILWSFIKWWKIWVSFLRQKSIYVFTEDIKNNINNVVKAVKFHL